MCSNGSTNGVARVEQLLCDHAFHELFIEELGWDRFDTSLHIRCRAEEYAVAPVAQKRGLAVFQCTLDRLALRDRRLLRAIQRGVRPYALENLLIYTDYEGTVQVWHWATNGARRRSLVHREHPFHSKAPPAGFAERLLELRVELEDEERVGLLDVTRNVAGTFDRGADEQVFFRNPRFLYESERLAAQLATGGTTALNRFIEFHDALARWVAQTFEYTGVELDDLEQMARIGLILAAHRFDPLRRNAFSTYAVYWIRQTCQRYVPSYVFHGKLRLEQYWRFHKLMRRFARHRLSFAKDNRRILRRFLRRDDLVGPWVDEVLRLWETAHLHQDAELERAVARMPDPTGDVKVHLSRVDDARLLCAAVDSLDQRGANIIRGCVLFLVEI